MGAKRYGLAAVVALAAVIVIPQGATAATPPVVDECVTSVKALPPVINNTWRKWGAERSALGCPTKRELVQRKRELSGGVDGVVEQVTFQFGVIIEAPRLGPGGWVAMYQGESAKLSNSLYVAWGGAGGRVPDSDITVMAWTDDRVREPYRQLAGRTAKNENAWSWINLHNNLQQGRKYSLQLRAPGDCVVTPGTPGYCYLVPPISLGAQQPRECKSVPIGTVGTYWRTEMKRDTSVLGCPVGVTGLNLPGYPPGTSRQHFENGAVAYRPDGDGTGAMVFSAWWETRNKPKNPGLFVHWESTYRKYDVWQIECTAHHNAAEKCSYESDDSLLKPTLGVVSGVGQTLKGRSYIGYTVQGQGCLSRTLAPSKCSGWSMPITMRWPKSPNPAPGG